MLWMYLLNKPKTVYFAVEFSVCGLWCIWVKDREKGKFIFGVFLCGSQLQQRDRAISESQQTDRRVFFIPHTCTRAWSPIPDESYPAALCLTLTVSL